MLRYLKNSKPLYPANLLNEYLFFDTYNYRSKSNCVNKIRNIITMKYFK